MAQLPFHLREKALNAKKDESEADGERPFVYSVSGIQRKLRSGLERGFPRIYVGGEVSNLTQHGVSGHAYFSLKDEDAQLRCVMWRDNVRRLRFDLADGVEVIARGKITLYERSGQLQMSVEALRQEGEGAQLEAFRRLAEKLREEGLTDPSAKSPIPEVPGCIGIVTSRDGAALRDVLRTILRRSPRASILLAAAPVQGPNARTEIAAALRRLDRSHPDVIILARGGGSAEDLAAFNHESLARTIVALNTPVVTGIGHETDTTIADLVADLAASTPTAAAEHVAPEQVQLLGRLADRERALARALRAHLHHARARLSDLASGLRDPSATIRQRAQALDELMLSAERSLSTRIKRERGTLVSLNERLAGTDPRHRLSSARGRLGIVRGQLEHGAAELVRDARHRHAMLAGRLDSASPVRILARGFAMVRGPDDTLLRDATDVAPGDKLRVRLARGGLEASVDSVVPENES